MVKLIATDMDGTLLDSAHKINSEFWSVYEELKKSGIAFSAASGRQYHNLVEQFESIKDEVIFIAENGSYVVKAGKEIFSQNLDKEILPKFVDIARDLEGVYPVFCGKKSAYIENTREDFILEVDKYYSKCEVVDDLKNIEDDILKVALYDFKCSETNCYPSYKQFEKEFKVVISAKHWLDIMHIDANKGAALRKVQEMLGISKAETMAFGDYLNDLELLENSEHSYAMADAHPDLKKVSKYIAGSNDENGVLEVIKEKILNK